MTRPYDEAERLYYHSDVFRQYRLFPAMACIQRALERARKPYIAFSGGKDSLAVFALVEMVQLGVPLIWSDDELEYPETVDYMELLRQLAGHQLVVVPGSGSVHAGWFRPWSDLPYWREPLPGTQEVGDRPLDVWAMEIGYDLTFLGLRAEENRRRRNWLAQAGPTYGGATRPRVCNPIWDWTSDDVWTLIAGQGVPYNAVYDRLTALHVPRKRQRVGPLPLVPRHWLEDGWPDLLWLLEARYRRRWGE